MLKENYLSEIKYAAGDFKSAYSCSLNTNGTFEWIDPKSTAIVEPKTWDIYDWTQDYYFSPRVTVKTTTSTLPNQTPSKNNEALKIIKMLIKKKHIKVKTVGQFIKVFEDILSCLQF